MHKKIEEEYKKFINKLPPLSAKKDLSKEVEKYAVKMKEVEGSPEEKEKWREEVALVEWVKNRTEGGNE